MAFTFNGAAKTITHSGGTLSVMEMWSRYVDWLAIGDNSKYGDLLTTVGRDEDDIPLYVFLEAGVTIVVSNNSVPTVVTDGVLKTRSGGDPFGGAVVNARYQAPGIAIGYSTSGGSSGPTAESIAAAILAAAQITPIHADTRRIKGQAIAGSGTESDPWGPS
ncbi:MAG: hypothetical protein ABFC42_05395 [Sulfuricella sp.]